MDVEQEAIRWPPRVRMGKLRRLYESDAQGLLNQDLLDDVGTALYARCVAIVQVHDAKQGRVHCPVCDRAGIESIALCGSGRSGLDDAFRCPRCGWESTWFAYRRTYRRRNLNSGGALASFQAFVRDWPRARTPQQQMLAVDALIHAWHRTYWNHPDQPMRSAAANLIEGKLYEVMEFLDRLTYGQGSTRGLAVAYQTWREEAERLPWGRLEGAEE